jgi:VWFA-related protein
MQRATYRTKIYRRSFAGSCIAIAILSGGYAWGQTAEMTSKESAVTFKSNTNLVPVPVVVRDSSGHAVGNLGIDDFQLLDNGKPQMISKFTVEKLAVATAPVPQPSVTADKPAPPPGALIEATGDGIPDHFIAYVFDDQHMSHSDMVYTRDAARRLIDSGPHALERTAIYTTSGRPMQEFTSDKEKLHKALEALGTGNAAATKNVQQSACPPMTYYMGDLIYNKNDQEALGITVTDTLHCLNLDPIPPNIELATNLSKQAAREAVANGNRETESALDTLRSMVARMASMPGQRTIVMISPGFLVLDDLLDRQTALIERALHANVVIGALDARGLYVEAGIPDASEAIKNPDTLIGKSRYRRAEATMQSDIMASLAEGTGGTFYHNSNDFDEGIARTATAPEYLYILGFSPLDLKLDGRYHNLKVTLKNPRPAGLRGADLQVRKGYYAPKYAADPAEQAKQQIEEAFFSRDEVHELPATLLTQYFKADNGDATLSAVAKVDVKLLSFRKEDGRNLDNLTVVTGLFDDDGNFVTGMQKTIEMRLLDDTLEKRLGQGMAVKSSFPVHPGKYTVRMVVRDSEGQTMASQSSLVEIP